MLFPYGRDPHTQTYWTHNYIKHAILLHDVSSQQLQTSEEIYVLEWKEPNRWNKRVTSQQEQIHTMQNKVILVPVKFLHHLGHSLLYTQGQGAVV